MYGMSESLCEGTCMECRRCEGTGIECQRVDVKEQVWNVRELM